MIVVFENINWDRDDANYAPILPSRVMIDERFFIDKALEVNNTLLVYLRENGADFLSDEFDFCVHSFTIKIVDDSWDYEWFENNRYLIYLQYI